MADCIQQDTNVLATSPCASRGPGVKKLVSKAILKSVIDINEDECNRCPSDPREGAKMLLGIKTVKSTGGKTNDKDMNAAKMVVTGNPKMTMSKNDSTPTTLVVQWCEAAVLVGPEGGIVKDLELSTGAKIKVAQHPRVAEGKVQAVIDAHDQGSQIPHGRPSLFQRHRPLGRLLRPRGGS